MPMTEEHDRLTALLLNRVQEDIPLASQPFARIGAEIGCSEQDVLERLRQLKKEKVIRQIGAIFDTRALGYQSTLVAAKASPEGADEAAAVISSHPGVSHNYLRSHSYNIWFTIALPPGVPLEESVQRLCLRAGVQDWLILPSLKMYKIKTCFDATGERPVTEKEAVPETAAAAAPAEETEDIQGPARTLGEIDIRAIRALQSDFPLAPAPYALLAAAAGITETELIATAQQLKEEGRLRRIAAVLHHRTAGFKANGMVVWQVPQGHEDRVGRLFASYRAVSHCYQRPTYRDWPYNIFTMVHGRTMEDCERVIEAMSKESGVADYQILYSLKEYKKSRVTYFDPKLDNCSHRLATAS